MKYIGRTDVKSEIASKHKDEIEKCNRFIDDLSGTQICIKTIQHGQPRAYADAVYESLIFCFRPNIYTTGAPAPTCITEEDARVLARMFVRDWGQHETPYLGGYLSFIKPEVDPAGLHEPSKGSDGKMISSCWRVRVIEPFND